MFIKAESLLSPKKQIKIICFYAGQIRESFEKDQGFVVFVFVFGWQ